MFSKNQLKKHLNLGGSIKSYRFEWYLDQGNYVCYDMLLNKKISGNVKKIELITNLSNWSDGLTLCYVGVLKNDLNELLEE